MSNIAMDGGTRIQAVDLITIAMGRLQRVHDSPQASSHHSEAKIALADLKIGSGCTYRTGQYKSPASFAGSALVGL